ncbi:hypothetical protein E3O42_12040 [Cryobacterium adonitolivorans]|uniref:DUF2975 domain-containing protein n=1 Tax=Cryobacterium adonitolivorans TaxID=1259189 RepID=A0A4R8W6R9_9MICO|nr:hypothetical protein [Cryobacterium adonitolivorans]TFC00826.1 hypothetical protein E3O42_12040 [Cryobacterium adonitolivorans]
MPLFAVGVTDVTCGVRSAARRADGCAVFPPTCPRSDELHLADRTARLERRLGRVLTWLALGGALLWGLLATGIGVATVVGQLLTDRFVVTLFADALLLGTVLWQGFGGLGRMIAAGELNGDAPGGFWPLATLVDLAPGGTGVVLLVAAAAISMGQRLQRETDGLV